MRQSKRTEFAFDYQTQSENISNAGIVPHIVPTTRAKELRSVS
jgi:hypothetical protein